MRLNIVAKIVCIAGSLSLFVSCTHDPNREGNETQLTRMRAVKDIALPLQATISNIPYTVQYSYDAEAQEDRLYVDNAYDKAIAVYDLATEQLVQEISFPQQEPMAIRNIQGWYLHSADSILVTSSTYKVYFWDRTRDTVHSVRLGFNEQKATLPVACTGRAVDLSAGVASFHSIPQRKPMYEGYINLDLDLTTDSVRINYRFPQELRERPWSIAQAFWDGRELASDRDWLYSFSSSDFLYKVDHQGKEERIWAGTRFSPPPKPMPDAEAALTGSGKEELIDNTVYTAIAYDPYQKLYYRIVAHPINAEIGDRAFEEKPLSVIVLNEDLQVIGEHRLPENLHHYFTWFVSRQGLCISLENPLNTQQGSERNLDFRCYTFEQR